MPARLLPRPARAQTDSWTTLRVLTPIAFILGFLLHLQTYESIQPLVVMLIVAAPMWFVLLVAFRAPEVRWGYSWLVSWYWLCAGISLLLDGPTQVRPGSVVDAEKFYTLLSLGITPTGLDDLRRFLEGPFAILVWNYLYEWVVNMGGIHLPHIGISINIFNISAAAVLSSLMVILINGYDRRRIISVFYLFSGCGIFILFATLHVRDAFICLVVSALAAIWCAFLVKRRLIWLFLIIVTTPIFTFVLHYLRYDLSAVPVAFAGVGLASLVAAKDIGRAGERVWINVLLVLGLLAVGFAIVMIGPDIIRRFEGRTSAYTEMAGDRAQSDSLGMALIVNQPLPVRLVLGPAYVLFMPIPLWGGSLLSGITYALTKAMGAVFFYFLVSRLAATVSMMAIYPRARRASVLFLLGVFLIFLMAIGATSLESRHIGPFVPMAIVASLAFSGSPEFNVRRKNWLKLILLAMLGVHSMWVVLKIL